MGSSFDVIVVGDYCLDLIFAGLPRFPELGIEIVAKNFDRVPGGAYNPAIALHRLGVRTGWAGDFGSDEYSQYILNCAHAEGIDCSLFVHHNQPIRRVTVALSYPHERAFIAYYEPNPAVPAALKALMTNSARIVYVSGLYHGSVLAAGMPLIRTKKMMLVMDGNCEDEASLSDPSIRKAIASTDIFMPNSGEVLRLTGESNLQAGIKILTTLCPLVVVKDGSGGAYACTSSETLYDPAIPIEPVDTTGAGDCFNAGFIRAWLNNLALQDCLRWGNVVGGLSTLALGGVGNIIREDDVLPWLTS
ncbi:MAG: carbohydrate kinase family protein [Anaerolineaceae bacterium]|nr:carbohydrate kinase family protein [Anaerolineaceae bacterium]